MPIITYSIETIRDESGYEEYEINLNAEPCLWCKSGNIELIEDKSFSVWYQVICQDCGARGPSRQYEKEAVEIWNAGAR